MQYWPIPVNRCLFAVPVAIAEGCPGKRRESRWRRVIAILLGSLASANGSPPNDLIPANGRDRSSLAEFEVVAAATDGELTPTDEEPKGDSFRTWSVSHGDAGSRRYSSLDQINRSNVKNLRASWTYRSKDGPGYIESNPIVVDGVIFAPTVGRAIVAIDAATGREIWRYRVDAPPQIGLEDLPARRGLVFWRGDETHGARVVFASGKWLYALDPKTGLPSVEFGVNGRTPLPTGGTAVGVIWQDTYIVPGFAGDIFSYDLCNGSLLWRFHTIPKSGEFGADTWDGPDRTGGDCWGGVALDEKRGIVYAAIGDPHPNYIGMGRLGDNLYADSLVALEARTGARLWHFQNVHHDLWDLDCPAPPNLLTINREGRRVDVVACVTKVGDTLLLDRVTGKPIFPFRLRRAPESTIQGEVTAAYQPYPELPEPFSSPEFKIEEATDRTPAAHDFILEQVRRSTFGWFAPPTEAKPLLYRSSRGGAEWTGACVDVPTGRIYVSVNHIVSKITAYRSDELDRDPAQPPSAGEMVFEQACAACHGVKRQGTGMVPSLLGLRHRMTDDQVSALLKTGRGQMPPAPPIALEHSADLLDFLMRRNQPPSRTVRGTGSRSEFFIGGFQFLTDPDGYPGSKPPWGTLDCLDLNTGRILWQVPLGEYEELKRQGLPRTGTENFGGPTVTAGGLVFCAGTRDEKIRAFDKDSGDELWSAKLPWGGYAPPTVYQVNGREFIVIAATGGGKLGTATGDAYVAFALPEK